MDELVSHCLRELSFDGDLGCDVNRLQDFIQEFYSNREQQSQTVDSAFYAFFWTVLVRQPTVLVGLRPAGITSDVYIAEQKVKKRKANNATDDERPALQLIEEAKFLSLKELTLLHGDALRIAVDPNTSFAAITGSHLRSSKLSPMVYTALQMISRGRNHGLSIIDLGKFSGYDQKTCFYLVRQLLELDLIVKCRKPGVGANFAILKHFYDSDPFWQSVREEGARDADLEGCETNQERTHSGFEGSEAFLHFDPIDARHLSSLDLLRSRIVTLLKAQERQMFLCTNILPVLGFARPTKRDRRFFATRMKALIQEGVIERVSVPKTHEQIGAASHVECFRLVPESGGKDIGNVTPILVDDDANELGDRFDSTKGIKSHVTIHKQISDMIECSGVLGMTSGELSANLCNFDKRTIELLLLRAVKFPPPGHLRDLATVNLMENYGRERRHRWWTDAGYRELATKDGLTSIETPQDGRNAVGQFTSVLENQFYADSTHLYSVVDSQCQKLANVRPKPPKKRVNPILPDGSIKRGRPKKDAPPLVKKRSANDADLVDQNQNQKRGRGHLRKGAKEEAIPELAEEGVIATALMAAVDSAHPQYPASTTSKGAGKRSRLPEQQASISKEDDAKDTSDIRLRKRIRQASPCEDMAVKMSSNVLPEVTQVSSSLVVPLLDNTSLDSSPNALRLPGLSLETDPCNPTVPMFGSCSSTSTDFALNAVNNMSPTQLVKIRTKNVSQMRRENELIRVLTEAGGVMNLSGNDLFDAHTDLLATLARAGEVSSAPLGTRLDKRTAMASFNILAERHLVKLLKTSIMTGAGNTRPVLIVHLPDISQPRLNLFLASLGRNQAANHPTKLLIKVDTPVTYGAVVSRARQKHQSTGSLHLTAQVDEVRQTAAKEEKAEELFQHDDKTIKDFLRTEKTTVGQIFGFKVARLQRARTAHLCAMQAFETSENISAHVVSRELRILDMSYFYSDVTLDTFCSIICVPEFSEELARFYATSEGKNTLIKEIPESLGTILRIRLLRTRSKLLDIFETLRSLDLVEKLYPTSREAPDIMCLSTDGQPAVFDTSPSEWTRTPSVYTCSIWRFKSIAPIRLWSISDDQPLVWKQVELTDTTKVISFWNDLQTACMDPQTCEKITTDLQATTLGFADAPAKLARVLRRKSSWNSAYSFTWHQEHYLRRFIAPNMAEISINDADNEFIKRISGVVSAPENAVREHYLRLIENMQSMAKRKKDRADQQRLNELDTIKRLEAGKLSLQQKAKAAKQRKEKRWQDMVSRVHPEPMHGSVEIRVRRLRSAFMQSAKSDVYEKWEDDIRGAIHEARLLTSELLATSKTSRLVSRLRLTPKAKSEVRSVTALIAQQTKTNSASLASKPRKSVSESRELKNCCKEYSCNTVPDHELGVQRRRHRFHWDDEFDDLARDAYVVIRARVQPNARLDWGAVSQVFPALPINSFRARVNSLKSGDEAYFQRLENYWKDIWIDHRGTEDLPDNDPASLTNFDLARHIEFLRYHVDKDALRVGQEQQIDLPISIEQLNGSWTVTEVSKPNSDKWSFMWDAFVDDGREKRLMREPFVHETFLEAGNLDDTSEGDLVIQAIMKVVFGTPQDRYDVEAGAGILNAIDSQIVSNATNALLASGMLAKKRESEHDGRGLKISEGSQAGLKGILTHDFFLDALGMEEMLEAGRDEWQQWPLVASDGETATLLQMVSVARAEFLVDISHSQEARSEIDWNSRRADDDHIENAISVRCSRSVERAEEPEDILIEALVQDGITGSSPQGHGLNLRGNPACCAVSSDGIVDCLDCLKHETANLMKSIGNVDKEITRQILNLAEAAGSAGVKKEFLLANMQASACKVLITVERLMTCQIPLLWKTGHRELVLVSANHIQPWTFVVSDDPMTRIFPRRWYDITGSRMIDIWKTALDAIVATVFFRPGIPEREIVRIHRAAYDISEIDDILKHLSNQGILAKRSLADYSSTNGKAESEWDVDCTFWFLADGRSWYSSISS